MGASIAVRSAGANSARLTFCHVAPPFIRPRMAVVISDTGFTSTNTRNQLGMVAGSTMIFDANTRGIIPVNPIVMTVLGVRITRPSTRNIQPIPKPTRTIRPEDAEDHPSRHIQIDAVHSAYATKSLYETACGNRVWVICEKGFQIYDPTLMETMDYKRFYGFLK